MSVEKEEEIKAAVTRASSYSLSLAKAIKERDGTEIPHSAGHVEYELRLLRKLLGLPEPVDPDEGFVSAEELDIG